GDDNTGTCRIGHLVLKDPEVRTNLGSLLELTEHNGALPLEIPIKGAGLLEADDLIADRHAYFLQQDYSPVVPKVQPIDVTLRLVDEEELDTMAFGDVQELRNRLTKHTEFGPSLRLVVHIAVHLPDRLQCGKTLRIRRMSLSWPTIPLLRSFSVELPDG